MRAHIERPDRLHNPPNLKKPGGTGLPRTTRRGSAGGESSGLISRRLSAGSQPQQQGKGRSPTRNPSSKAPPERVLPKQWSKCSLVSIESGDEDEILPIPGRESHTSDLDQFMNFIQRVSRVQRFAFDTPFSPRVWVHFKDLLSTATSVGFTELKDPDQVTTMGPKENQAFIDKFISTRNINPIDPLRLSEDSGIPLDEILTELLFARTVGMAKMSWAPNCERPTPCFRPRRNAATLNSRRSAYCNGCTYKNAIQVLHKLKVSFQFNPDVFYALCKSFDCRDLIDDSTEFFGVVPATFTGSGFRYCLGCGEDKMMREALTAGEYDLFCPVTKAQSILIVERDAAGEDDPVTLRIHVSDTIGKIKLLESPHGKIQFDIFTDTHSFYICWIVRRVDFGKRNGGTIESSKHGGPISSSLPSTPSSSAKKKSPTPFLSAARLMGNPTYQNLFEGTQVESEHFSSAVRQMKLLPSQPAAATPIAASVAPVTPTPEPSPTQPANDSPDSSLAAQESGDENDNDDDSSATSATQERNNNSVHNNSNENDALPEPDPLPPPRSGSPDSLAAQGSNDEGDGSAEVEDDGLPDPDPLPPPRSGSPDSLTAQGSDGDDDDDDADLAATEHLSGPDPLPTPRSGSPDSLAAAQGSGDDEIIDDRQLSSNLQAAAQTRSTRKGARSHISRKLVVDIKDGQMPFKDDISTMEQTKAV